MEEAGRIGLVRGKRGGKVWNRVEQLTAQEAISGFRPSIDNQSLLFKVNFDHSAYNDSPHSNGEI